MTYTTVELILMQYSYRRVHATTTCEITEALADAVNELLELHEKSKKEHYNEPEKR